MAQHFLSFGVHLYRWVLSPAKSFLFGPLCRCRYTPSCSEYALGAIQTQGACAGSWLAVKRICRCHPWGGCGEDPVPQRKSETRHPEPGGTEVLKGGGDKPRNEERPGDLRLRRLDELTAADSAR